MSEAEAKEQGREAETCRQAVQSPFVFALGFLVLLVSLGVAIKSGGISALLGLIGFGISSLIAVILGIVALYRIRKSNGRLAGKLWAILGIGLVMSSIAFLIIVPLLSRAHAPSPQNMCGVNLSGLGKAMMLYGGDYDGKYPTSDKWCDLLIQYCDIGLKQFVCRSSYDVVIGESSYAFNKYLVGKKMSEVPGDVVLLFETNFGKMEWDREEVLASRGFGKLFTDNEFIAGRPKDQKVYRLRWNQVGGPEILTIENHYGGGCNIVFNDGHVEFVKKENLGQLRWKVEGDQ